MRCGLLRLLFTFVASRAGENAVLHLDLRIEKLAHCARAIFGRRSSLVAPRPLEELEARRLGRAHAFREVPIRNLDKALRYEASIDVDHVERLVVGVVTAFRRVLLELGGEAKMLANLLQALASEKASAELIRHVAVNHLYGEFYGRVAELVANAETKEGVDNAITCFVRVLQGYFGIN